MAHAGASRRGAGRRVRALRFGESSWHNADIETLAAAIRGFDEPVVDLVAAFGIPPVPHLQGTDGVHPTVDGQATIVTALLDRLAAR